MKYIFLDVDGVLNFDNPSEDSYDTEIPFNGSALKVRLNKFHPKWIRDLSDDTGAQIVWATAWINFMPQLRLLGAELGLNDLPYAHPGYERRYSEDVNYWKSRGVLKFAGESRFVWFDDDLYNTIYLSSKSHNGKLIHVNYRTGLTLSDIERARKFLNSDTI